MTITKSILFRVPILDDPFDWDETLLFFILPERQQRSANNDQAKRVKTISHISGQGNNGNDGLSVLYFLPPLFTLQRKASSSSSWIE